MGFLTPSLQEEGESQCYCLSGRSDGPWLTHVLLDTISYIHIIINKVVSLSKVDESTPKTTSGDLHMYILVRKPLALQLETITLSNIIYFKSIICISKYLHCPKICTWKSVVALMWPPSGPCPPIQLPGGRSPFALWPFSNFLIIYMLLIVSLFWGIHNQICSWRLHLIF